MDSMFCNVFVALISLSVRRFPSPHEHFLVKGGITRVALLVSNRSLIVKPLSAITSSPALIVSRNPHFLVMYLSDVLPPHRSEMKLNAPLGVISTKVL
jgi:hypothetical protein